MITFLKSIDSKTWKVVVTEWEHPTTITDDTGKVTPKLKLSRTYAEDKASWGNSHNLDAIFNDVDQNVFKLINTCTSAQEALKNLEVAYEGTTKVKMSRL